MPTSEKVKIPVAIKVIDDCDPSQDILGKARILASVNHPSCIRIIAVSLVAAQLKLVTPLLPLKCLLEYVKVHKSNIGAKTFLDWATQIASVSDIFPMSYCLKQFLLT
jgi:serine/threonine protein kinase